MGIMTCMYMVAAAPHIQYEMMYAVYTGAGCVLIDAHLWRGK